MLLHRRSVLRWTGTSSIRLHEMVTFWSLDHYSRRKRKNFFYLTLFERLFALAFKAWAIPSPETGRSDAATLGYIAQVGGKEVK